MNKFINHIVKDTLNNTVVDYELKDGSPCDIEILFHNKIPWGVNRGHMREVIICIDKGEGFDVIGDYLGIHNYVKFIRRHYHYADMTDEECLTLLKELFNNVLENKV
jgi:hypothetical protein